MGRIALLGAGNPPAASGGGFDLTLIGRNASAVDQATYTFAAQGIGTADATRKVIFGVFGRRSAAGATVTATLNGNSAAVLTTVNYETGASNRMSIFGYDEPSGTTGDIVATFDAAMLRCAIDVARLVNYSGSPNVASNSTFGTSVGATVTVPAGGKGYAFAFTNDTTSLTLTGTGVTQSTTQSIESGLTRSATLDTAGSITVTATPNASAVLVLALVAYGP